MPGTDPRLRALHCCGRRERARLQPHSTGRAARVASARQLMPQGSGLVIPRLGGVPLVHRLVADDRLAVLLATSLIELDIASPADWTKAECEPTSFAGMTLGRWVEAHGGAAIRRRFVLEARISTSPSAWAEDDEANPQRLFLTVEPSEAGCAVFGPTLKLLEGCHPSLPATFFFQFVAALNRWIRVYDLRDAEERIENLKDWIANEPEADQYELPDVQGSIPPCMKHTPLGLNDFSRLVGQITEAPVAKMVAGLLDLKKVSEKAERPQLDDGIGELLSDCNPPLPALLAIFAEADGIAAAFDEESEGMMEVTPEPNLIIPFDPGNQESVKQAFDAFGVACETLAAASRLMDVMLGNEKWVVSG